MRRLITKKEGLHYLKDKVYNETYDTDWWIAKEHDL